MSIDAQNFEEVNKTMENYSRMTTAATCGCRRSNNCFCIILSVIGGLLAFVLGLIVGLTATEALAPYLPAIVAIAIVLAVMFVVFVILRYCKANQC